MVNNVFVQCNACKMKINLRVQIGLFDIPFMSVAPSVILLYMEKFL